MHEPEYVTVMLPYSSVTIDVRCAVEEGYLDSARLETRGDVIEAVKEAFDLGYALPTTRAGFALVVPSQATAWIHSFIKR